jgi:hypothetical protein
MMDVESLCHCLVNAYRFCQGMHNKLAVGSWLHHIYTKVGKGHERFWS